MKRDDKRTSGKMGVDGKMKGESGRGKTRRILFLTNYGLFPLLENTLFLPTMN